MTSSESRVLSRSLVQVAHYPPSATYGPRPLRDFEFVWVLSGTARWQVTEPGPTGEVREVDLVPGTLALARPGTTDSYRWDDRRPSSHAFVHFEVGRDVGTAVTAGCPLTRHLARHEPLGALCGYLLDLASVGGQEAKARSDQVLGLLFDLFRGGPFPRSSAESRIPPPLLPALDHVRRAWRCEGVRSVRVTELSAAAGMSQGHFSRSFTQAFDCGPAAALELVRLARAATSPQRSNLPISEIARHHGFADAYHFSKRFAATYHLPPGRFRARGEDVDPQAPLAARGLLTLWASLTTGSTSAQSNN